MTRDVSVILPTVKEHRTVCSVIEAAREAVGDRDYEIVVVDDSPTSRTVDVVHDTYHHDACVRWLHRGGNGLASAVLEGFDLADGERYVVLDADGQHPPRRIRNLLYRLDDGADLAVCSRHVDGGDVAGDWPTHRRVISHGAETLAQMAVPTARKLSDPMSGYFAVEADVVEPVRERLRPSGYKILLELVARCPVGRIDEVPFTFAERAEGDSNLGASEYLKYIKHLIKITIPARRDSVQVVSGEVEHVDG